MLSMVDLVRNWKLLCTGEKQTMMLHSLHLNIIEQFILQTKRQLKISCLLKHRRTFLTRQGRLLYMLSVSQGMWR